jgi:hypothetical protein
MEEEDEFPVDILFHLILSPFLKQKPEQRWMLDTDTAPATQPSWVLPVCLTFRMASLNSQALSHLSWQLAIPEPGHGIAVRWEVAIPLADMTSSSATRHANTRHEMILRRLVTIISLNSDKQTLMP